VLPGKKYRPEDYLFTAWRRKWLLVVPVVVVSAATFAYVSTLPDRYRAQARVLVVPQQVPETYVRSTITTPLQDRLQAMSQQILSRTRLEQIIREFNLYPEERRTRIFEDVVEQMRSRDIHIDVPRGRTRREGPSYFTIGFDAANPRTAVQVTDRLVALFIQENVQDRALLAQQTSTFLESQLEEAGRKLAEQERQLEEFRSANAGTLPSQVNSNLSVMQSAQTQLRGVIESINRDRDRELTLERMMEDMTAAAASRPAPSAGAGTDRPQSTAEQLASARAGLQALQLRLKPEHPDVQRAIRIVAELQQKVEAEAANAPLAPGTTPALPGLTVAQQQQLIQMRAEHESLQRRIATATVEQQRLDKQLAEYRARVELVPQRESQIAVLTRDYETLQENYRKLLSRTQDAKAAADLERRQIGQNFRIIDSARLPERPTSPDRLRLNGMGLGAGLALGVLLIAFFEYRDSSFRSRDDIITVLALPVLAVVPRMITTGERRRYGRRRLYAVAATCALALVAVAVSAWKLRLLDTWAR
jgi:polysaccharide chain length determinant protein (PEP-CTERM system associated)